MSGYNRTVFISKLFRSLGGGQCSKIFNRSQTCHAQSLWISTNRSGHNHWSSKFAQIFFLNVKPTWTSCQSNLSSEARVPFKEDDYPPLPEYDPNPPPASKDIYIVRVNGLPWSCKKEDLLEFFSECRIRDGLKGIHFLHLSDGRPTGQAFLEMEAEEDVSKALERHRQYLGPRYVEVFEVTEQDAESILKGAESPLPKDGIVKLRGLPYSCTEQDIEQFFSGLDIVENGITMVFNSRGRSMGQAFVQFASQDMADKALEKDREVIGQRYVEIFASSRNEIKLQQRRTLQQTPPPSPPSPAAVQSPSTTRPLPTRTGRSAASQAGLAPVHYVLMRGLPYGSTAEDIVAFFAPLRLARIMVEYHSDGKPSGEAEVHFRSHEDAVAAMVKDKEYMQNRYIELFLNSSR